MAQTLNHPQAAPARGTPGPANRRNRGWSLAVGGVLALVTLAAATWLLWPDKVSSSAPEDICLVAPPQPWNSASGVALLAPRPIPADARCPVCGMFPARAPQWAAQAIFKNGDAHYFDSPVSLYLFLQAVERFSPGRSAGDVAATFVTDMGTRAWTPAAQAHYVHGSKALGPMRNGNLPAFASPQAAQIFADQQGGQVLRADQITPALLVPLDTRSAQLHSAHAK